MRIIPAVAGAVVVTGLAFWVGVGGATMPDEPPDAEPAVSTPGHAPDHARSGKPDKAEKDDESDRAEKSDEGDKGKGKARGHDKGKARGHDKAAPPHAQGRVPKAGVPAPPGLMEKGEACVGHTRYEDGRLEPCPWNPHPHGKLVPAGPRPYSETEE